MEEGACFRECNRHTVPGKAGFGLNPAKPPAGAMNAAIQWLESPCAGTFGRYTWN
jgi:hypothetical protein